MDRDKFGRKAQKASVMAGAAATAAQLRMLDGEKNNEMIRPSFPPLPGCTVVYVVILQL